jgi:thymidylate kinase
LELRTPERFGVPGGNVHYERFAEEVIPYLSSEESFSYRIFDCSQMDYDGVRQIESSCIRVVEGAYSCHPYFGNYADITVFSDVNAEEQMKRIYKRNGEKMAQMFKERWIPLEERYFQKYKTPLNTDLILN